MAWAPDYATSELVKDYLRIEDADDDVFIALWIKTVSRNVDDHCGRQFGIVDAPEARRYTPVRDRGACSYVAEVDDVFDVDAVTAVDAAGTAVTDLEFWPLNAPLKGRPYTRVRTATSSRLTITGPWGWPADSDGPVAAQTGLLLQAARLAARRDSPFGVAGSPSEGSELRLLAQLDPDFRTTLKPFRRRWWAR